MYKRQIVLLSLYFCALQQLNSSPVYVQSKVEHILNTIVNFSEDCPDCDIPDSPEVSSQKNLQPFINATEENTSKVNDSVIESSNATTSTSTPSSNEDISKEKNKSDEPKGDYMDQLKGDNINEGLSGVLLGVGSVAVGALAIDMGLDELNDNTNKALGIVAMTGSTAIVVGGAALVTFGVFVSIWGVGRLFCWW